MKESSKPDEMIKLEKILGLTTLSSASIASSPICSDIYYAAGSCVVCYNADENIQRSFYKALKAISCLTVSPDGRYLAVGERGHSPSIMVWELSSGDLISTISGSHTHGIGCLAFSPNCQFLVSAGFKHDRQLIIWDWESQKKASVQKLGNKVKALRFHPDGSFFVTCGDRHLKWWYLTYKKEEPGFIEVSGKPASILESHKNAVFMDVKVGLSNFVYCTTSTGLLCAFNETRFMDMWVQLDSSASYSLDIFELSVASIETKEYVAVGCTEGLIRVFSTDSLQYLATLPLPVPPVGYTERERFPACLALCKITKTPIKGKDISESLKLCAVYADHSLFVWEISDVCKATQFRSFTYHSSCIFDVQFIANTLASNDIFPPASFVTCSADNSIRIWNTDPKAQRLNKGKGGNERSRLSAASSSASSTSVGEMLHLIELDTSPESNDSDSLADLSASIPDTELPDRPQTALAPTAIALHPSGRQLACGDKGGLLRVFDLASMREIYSIQAHTAEVLTLNYSPTLRPLGDGTWIVDNPDEEENGFGKETSHQKQDTVESSLVLLASAGRDRLVHVFSASEQYKPIASLDNHSSSVTVAKFTPNGRRLLSCGGDRTLVFNSVNGTDITRIKSVQTPHGTINGLSFEATSKFAITSGQVLNSILSFNPLTLKVFDLHYMG
jgi:WD40 repeat protein